MYHRLLLTSNSKPNGLSPWATTWPKFTKNALNLKRIQPKDNPWEPLRLITTNIKGTVNESVVLKVRVIVPDTCTLAKSLKKIEQLLPELILTFITL